MSDDTLTTGPLPLGQVRARLSSPAAAGWTLRIAAALLVVIGGYVHADLYVNGGYSAIPVVGPMFLANIVASALVGLAVLVKRGRLVALAGLALTVGSLLALAAAHTVGIAGFTESSFGSAQLAAVLSESAATVAFGWLSLRSRA